MMMDINYIREPFTSINNPASSRALQLSTSRSLQNTGIYNIITVTIYGRGFGFILIILLLVGFYIQKSYVRFSYTFDRLDF